MNKNMIKYLVLSYISLLYVAGQSPAPGSIGLTLNVTSVSNAMQSFVPLFAYYMLPNTTIQVDQVVSKSYYKFDIEKVVIQNVTGFTTKTFEMKDNNELHISMGGIDIFMDIDGQLDLFYFIPFLPESLIMRNLTIDFIVSFPSTDHIHFKIDGNTTVTLPDND